VLVKGGRLIAAGRKDDANKEKILDFISDETENGEKTIQFKVLEDRFIKGHEMSKPTVFSNLKKLELENKIMKIGKGEYKLAA